ncbi:MAG: FAD-binding oxidoreductase [Pseudomonadota bacterium]
MRRAYPDHAYDPAPPPSYWAATAPEAVRRRRPLDRDLSVEVAIVGGGYTGLSAALTLAERGAGAAVFDAAFPGWGASGRNGGFVCVGGAKLGYDELIRRDGEDATRAYVARQAAAVDHVGGVLDRFAIDADRHSTGEWELSHSAKAFARAKEDAALERRLGLTLDEYDQRALDEMGMAGPTFHGGHRRLPGFAVNPLKYAHGLAMAAERAGAELFTHSPAHEVKTAPGGFHLRVGGFSVRARKLIVAANGYLADDWIPGLDDRALPVMSSIMVTRPLTGAELQGGGWTSDQAAYDSRSSVHYFRLLPEGRFMFGARGGSSLNPILLARLRRRIRRDFERMFPAWAHVEADYEWNGLLALSRSRTQYVGPLEPWADAWTAFAYHGNGVAMGTYAGRLLGEMALGDLDPAELPPAMSGPPRRFPLPRLRMAYIKAYYLGWDAAEAIRG